jgi:hypothetical protein
MPSPRLAAHVREPHSFESVVQMGNRVEKAFILRAARDSIKKFAPRWGA